MALFDDVTNQRILKLRKEINEISEEEFAGSWVPHITLGVYGEEILDELVSYTKEFSKNRSIVSSSFNTIGQFLHNEKYPRTDVFYLAPAIPQNLTDFYASFHKRFENNLSELGRDYLYYGGFPTIHSTVAICDVESFVKVISFMHQNFSPISFEIVGIQVSDMEKNVLCTYYFSKAEQKK